MKTSLIQLYLTLSLLFTGLNYVSAQNLAPIKPEPRKMIRIEHVDLVIEPVLESREIKGEAKLVMSPYWKTINSIELDAEYMLIHKVYVNEQEKSFNYDGKKLNIDLERSFGDNQRFEVKINYTARPERRAEVLPSENYGVYFTDSKGTDPDMSTQIWTQGITQGTRLWFPTVDEPNQLFSHSLSIKRDQSLHSISNGTLVESTLLGDGKMLDKWILEEVHAPYQTFFALTDKALSFSNTDQKVQVYAPEKWKGQLLEKSERMLDLFGQKLNYDYPFENLNIVVLDEFLMDSYYGAGIVILSEELLSRNRQGTEPQVWEKHLASQIFKQWFGGLVSPESWSQIALSESMGGFGRLLWLEQAYDSTIETEELVNFSQNLLNSQELNPLLRKRYEQSDALLDATTEYKGALVFQMLKHYLGDQGFFKGLNTYLIDNKNQKTELSQFRLAMEKSTGLDLNWFFDQWFLKTGIPQVQMDYDFNTQESTVTVTVKQLTDVYQFPLKLSKYEAGQYDETVLWIDGRQKSFVFPYNEIPDLFEVNNDFKTLASIQDNKTTQKLMFQAMYSVSAPNRLRALDDLKGMQSNPDIFKVFEKSIVSEDAQISSFALQNLDLSNKTTKRNTIKNIVGLAQGAQDSSVRAAAIELLGKLVNPEYYSIFKAGLLESSVQVQGASLTALYYINQDEAFDYAKNLEDEAKKGIAYPLVSKYIKEKQEKEMDFVASYLIDGMYLLNDKEIKQTYEKGFDWVIKSDNPSAIKNLCNSIVDKSRQYKSYGFSDVGIDLLRRMISEQYKLNYDNREEIIAIVTGALDKLIQD